MRALVLSGILMLLALRPAPAQSPHEMTKEDGTPDPAKCSLCHNDDFSLRLPPLETCLMCHAASIHSGAGEHVRASAAAVARLLPAQRNENPRLPLTREGRIYCGTCHVFHDPKVTGEAIQPESWVPPADGLAGAVRDSVERRLRLAATPSAYALMSAPTRRLRLAVNDGSLCKHCHGYGK